MWAGQGAASAGRGYNTRGRTRRRCRRGGSARSPALAASWREADMAACARCGFESPPAFRFCGACGAPLVGLPGPPPEALAERRQLTVMFCDLVGSTGLSERLDPEELRELLGVYHRTCGEVIQRLDGHVAQLLGDGLLVYFGYPTAHPDDARRAVQAALEILGSLEGIPVRIGIHTGMVVVGDVGPDGHREQLALGDTPNIAARLQGLAAPDTVVLSAATRRLCERLFNFEDLGDHELKGLSRPIRVYRAVDPSLSEDAVTSDSVPLVGREAEVHVLESWWARARTGEGRVGVLRGRSGTGRSRLARELQSRVLADGGLALVAFCSAVHQGTTLYPVVDLLERLLGFERGDPPERRLQKLQAHLPSKSEGTPYLAALLGLSAQCPPAAGLTPQALKQRVLHALADGLRELTARNPVLLVLEDLDLADSTTLEFVAEMAAQVGGLPLLMLLLVETLEPCLPPGSPLVHLELQPLSKADTRLLVRGLAPDLDEQTVERVVERSDGIPVYARELVRLAQEAGDFEGIPSTLHDSLMAWLDRQAESKEVAQLGAAIGRRFREELLAELSERPVGPHLDRLVRNDLLDQRGSRYAFQTALLHDAAYQSLLKSVRQRYHERIASALERSFPEVVEGQPEVLAHHLTEARSYPRALEFWARAGDLAMALSGNHEALRTYGRALEILPHLDDQKARAQAELRLRTAMAPALIATRGYASPEVEATYERARELCTVLDEATARFPVLAGLWVFHLVRGRLARAEELARLLLGLAGQDPTLLLVAHTAWGQTALWQGRLAEAVGHLQEGLDRHDPLRDRTLARVYFGTDPAVGSLCYLSWARWLQGRTEAALEASARSLDLAESLEHAHSLAHARIFACWLHLNLGDLEAAARLSAESLVLSAEQGFPLWLGVARVLGGCAAGPEGAGEVVAGLQILETTQTRLGVSFFAGLMAGLHATSGNTAEALAVLDQALMLEERWWEPELLRLRAGILRARGRAEEARQVLDQALARAREAGAAVLAARVESDRDGGG